MRNFQFQFLLIIIVNISNKDIRQTSLAFIMYLIIRISIQIFVTIFLKPISLSLSKIQIWNKIHLNIHAKHSSRNCVRTLCSSLHVFYNELNLKQMVSYKANQVQWYQTVTENSFCMHKFLAPNDLYM